MTYTAQYHRRLAQQIPRALSQPTGLGAVTGPRLQSGRALPLRDQPAEQRLVVLDPSNLSAAPVAIVQRVGERPRRRQRPRG